MKILVTGFKPFLQQQINPSEKLALDLAESFEHVESLILPVEFETSFKILKAQIIKSQPDCLVMLGQAAGRKNICIEKIALNWVQSGNQDESGVVPKTGRILPAVELALMASFPVDSIFLQLKRQNFPVEVSFSAGTYVCNDLYFRVLNDFKDLPSVFVHVPLLPEQVKKASSPGNEISLPSLEYVQQLDAMKQMISFVKLKN